LKDGAVESDQLNPQVVKYGVRATMR